MKRLLLIPLILSCATSLFAADPTATHYPMDLCVGSYRPYPVPEAPSAWPDSLTPVFINHVSRHGARYPSSASNTLAIAHALEKASEIGTITPLGKELLALTDEVRRLSDGRWGALDSLGIAEQEGIAARMFANYMEVFSRGGTVSALSSYVPRCMMSMFAFVHELDRLNKKLTFVTTTGEINSKLMRPFDTDEAYIDFRRSDKWKPPYKAYFDATCPVSALSRVLGDGYPYASEGQRRDLAMAEYGVVAVLEAMGLPSQMDRYFTLDEANALWSCNNLKQYLQRTATTVSAIPADIATDLVLDLVSTTDAYISGTSAPDVAVLRFGHAETMMPLLSLLRIPGCYYLTNYFDTVGSHWRNFDVVPMASNLQFILFKSKTSGRYYVRVEFNEHTVEGWAGSSDTYIPWPQLRRYLIGLVS